MELDIQTIARRVDNLKQRNGARDARMQDILAVRKGELGTIYPICSLKAWTNRWWQTLSMSQHATWQRY